LPNPIGSRSIEPWDIYPLLAAQMLFFGLCVTVLIFVIVTTVLRHMGVEVDESSNQR
jgi:hypothetical protein